MPDSHLSQCTSLRRQHLRSFQRRSINICYKTYKRTKYRLFCRTVLQMCRKIRRPLATA